MMVPGVPVVKPARHEENENERAKLCYRSFKLHFKGAIIIISYKWPETNSLYLGWYMVAWIHLILVWNWKGIPHGWETSPRVGRTSPSTLRGWPSGSAKNVLSAHLWSPRRATSLLRGWWPCSCAKNVLSAYIFRTHDDDICYLTSSFKIETSFLFFLSENITQSRSPWNLEEWGSMTIMQQLGYIYND